MERRGGELRGGHSVLCTEHAPLNKISALGNSHLNNLPLLRPRSRHHTADSFLFLFCARMSGVLLCTAESCRLITTVRMRCLDDSDSDVSQLKAASCRCRHVDDRFRKWTSPSWGIPRSASPSWRHPSEMPRVWLMIRLSVAQMNSHCCCDSPVGMPPGTLGRRELREASTLGTAAKRS